MSSKYSNDYPNNKQQSGGSYVKNAHFTMGNLVEKVVNHEYAKQMKQKDYAGWLKSDAGSNWQTRQNTKQW
ncbi:ORF126 [Betabaculovirus altermyunipunctae]|uniref:ORF126 n=1 Tax=Betabaculovirus altermyunipunctae TaxID=3051996 RepID=A0A1S5YE16_9BBAC|nr:ORF126 [Betabaculovirus altermyunipunctae]AQQ80393.1 ORF126 [Betabaculovirus altermyunipunctae]